MNYRKGITKLELVIIIVFVFIALAIFMPTTTYKGDIARRQICLVNLKNLGMAWITYAEDNDKLICASTFASEHDIEYNGTPPWSGSVYSGRINMLKPEEEQTEAIKEGALWPYINSVSTYKCPDGMEGHMVTYAGMDSMNGLAAGLGSGKDEESIFITNKNNITSPAERITFLDLGYVSYSSYKVSYDEELWSRSAPSIRHADGTTYSFADGHSEYHRWEGQLAIALGKEQEHAVVTGIMGTIIPKPQTAKDANDLQWIQKGCWGKLGYEPSF